MLDFFEEDEVEVYDTDLVEGGRFIPLGDGVVEIPSDGIYDGIKVDHLTDDFRDFENGLASLDDEICPGCGRVAAHILSMSSEHNCFVGVEPGVLENRLDEFEVTDDDTSEISESILRAILRKQGDIKQKIFDLIEFLGNFAALLSPLGEESCVSRQRLLKGTLIKRVLSLMVSKGYLLTRTVKVTGGAVGKSIKVFYGPSKKLIQFLMKKRQKKLK